MPSFRHRTAIRIAAAVLIGVAFAAYEDIFRVRRPEPSDFAQPRIAGQLLLDGRNPYREIGPDGPVRHRFHLIYPVTAAVVAMPFGFATPRAADAIFVGIGAALLFWALTRETFRNPQLLVFTALPMTTAAQTVQWSPMLTAATVFPALGFVYACKPSVAMAYWAAYPSARALLAAAAFTALTIAIWPWWPGEWVAQLSTVSHMSAPISRWGGPLLLLSALRWRRPEARLLLGLSCVPQTPVIYEALPLFLVVSTIREAVVLLVVSILLGPIVGRGPGAYDDWMAHSGFWMVWLVYLPCLVMVLRRPNVAPPQDPVERTVARLRDYVGRFTATAAVSR